jgi:hypothetical protein
MIDGDKSISEPRARVTHVLKTWPEFFQATLNGRKKFELRRNDRDFRVADELRLQEWDPDAGNLGGRADVSQYGYTGREVLVRVDYIMDSMTVDRLMNRFQDGAQMSGYVIMSVSLIP